MGSNGAKMEAPASKEEIKEAFSKADSSGDGKLTFQQVKEILAALAPEGENKGPEFDRMADMVCHMADLNGDKMIDFGEILMFSSAIQPPKRIKQEQCSEWPTPMVTDTWPRKSLRSSSRWPAVTGMLHPT